MPSPMTIAGDPIANRPQSLEANRQKVGVGQGAPSAPPSRTAVAPNPVITMPIGMPGQPGLFQPGQIEIDREVDGAYQSQDGTTVQVEAVCKVTEDSIVCKRPDGKRDKDLEAKLDRILQGNVNPISFGIPFRYKHKNRLVLFRKEIPGQPGNQSNYVSILRVGNEDYPMAGPFINLSSLASPADGKRHRIQYEMRAVAVPFSQKEVDALIRSTKPEPLNGELKLKAGSQVRSGKHTITYIGHTSTNDKGPGSPSKSWDIRFRISPPDSKANFVLSPIAVGNDNDMVVVDDQGRIVESAHQARTPLRGVRLASAVPVSAKPDELAVRTNIDPKYLEGFRVTLFVTETVKLKKIPLD